jgi:hypothetical protein
MQSPQREKRIFIALCVNAAVLVLILLAVLSRDGRVVFASPALAQQAPVAGGNGLFVMPAQLAPSTWGCYLMDVDNQTLCVYQYSPGEKMLRLSAARSVKFDRALGNFNTNPPPTEIRDWVQREQEALRGAESQPAKSPEVPKEH